MPCVGLFSKRIREYTDHRHTARVGVAAECSAPHGAVFVFPTLLAFSVACAILETFSTNEGRHFVPKRKLFGKTKNRFTDSALGETRPRTFWKTTAIIFLTGVCIALGVGFESAMEDMLPNVGRYQDLQVQYGPIFHGAMKTEIERVARTIDQDLAISTTCLVLLGFCLIWNLVLITRRILIHAAWRSHATR